MRDVRCRGCDIGGIVTSQLGHKYADELYGIHIGSGLPLNFFNGPRAWDFARNRPLTDDQPAAVRARIIELDHRSASHLAVHMLDGATLAHGLSDSPAGLLAWLLERWNAWSEAVKRLAGHQRVLAAVAERRKRRR